MNLFTKRCVNNYYRKQEKLHSFISIIYYFCSKNLILKSFVKHDLQVSIGCLCYGTELLSNISSKHPLEFVAWVL